MRGLEVDGPDMKDPVTGKMEPVYELQLHLGLRKRGTPFTGNEDIELFERMVEHPTKQHLGPTENTYRRAKGYQLRGSYGWKARVR